jgi:hypothetical protein
VGLAQNAVTARALREEHERAALSTTALMQHHVGDNEQHTTPHHHHHHVNAPLRNALTRDMRAVMQHLALSAKEIGGRDQLANHERKINHPRSMANNCLFETVSE